MTRFRQTARLVACFALLPVLAHAHPGHDGHELTWDFQSGFAHPFLGRDHLLAMIAVGLWAAQLGGRARWLVPSSFVGAMALGAWVAQAGVAFSGVQQGVAASVLVLGLLVSRSAKLPLVAGALLTALFALFHGLAHGVEMPPAAQGLSYGAGFIAATVILHLVGLSLGVFATKTSERAQRYAGWGIAASGVVMLALG